MRSHLARRQLPRATATRRSVSPLLVLAVALPLVLTLLPARAEARKVFLFAEMDNGIAVPSDDVYGEVGYAMRGAFGVGGRWRWLPFRLYGVLSVSWTHLESTHRSTYHRSGFLQNSVVVALGLRADFRVWQRLRMMIDIAGGYRWSFHSVEIDGRESYAMQEGHFLPIVGVGLRYRLLRMLSLGLRSEWLLIPQRDGVDVPVAAAGLETREGQRWQANVVLTATVHF